MKIAVLSEGGYIPGRWERFDLMVQGLRGLGHEMKVFSLGPARENDDHVVAADVSHRPLLRLLNAAFYHLTQRLFIGIGNLLATIPSLVAFRPDAIMFHRVTPGIFAYFLSRFLAKPPLLVFDWNDLLTRMQHWPQRSGLRYRLARWLEEEFLPRKADSIIVVTEFARNLLTSWSLPPGGVFVLNELVALEPYEDLRTEFSPSEDTQSKARTLIWHGFVRPYQVPGLKSIMEVMALLQQSDIFCNLEIVGPFDSAEDECEIRELAQDLDVPVELHGFVPKANLRRLLIQADVGLHPLPDELFCRYINGVKLAEYICAGLPVVVSNLEGPAELVRGNGCLVSMEDLAELSEGIRRLLGEEGTYLAHRSIEIANQEFSQSSISEKMEQLSDFLHRQCREVLMTVAMSPQFEAARRPRDGQSSTKLRAEDDA